MASSSSSLNFLAPMDVKLNGSNYKEWFTIVHIILIGLELLGQVDGTSSQPSEHVASWTLAGHCTMTRICQSYKVDVRMEIEHLPTACAMWERLGNMFEHSSSTHQYAILQDITHVQ